MWTIKYKQGWIHGYTDREECRCQVGNRYVVVKNLLAAKFMVTKLMKDF